MTLPIEAAALVLLAALLHASWNALVKAGHDRLAVLAIANGVGVLIALFIAPFVPLRAMPKRSASLSSPALRARCQHAVGGGERSRTPLPNAFVGRLRRGAIAAASA